MTLPLVDFYGRITDSDGLIVTEPIILKPTTPAVEYGDVLWATASYRVTQGQGGFHMRVIPNDVDDQQWGYMLFTPMANFRITLPTSPEPIYLAHLLHKGKQEQ